MRLGSVNTRRTASNMAENLKNALHWPTCDCEMALLIALDERFRADFTKMNFTLNDKLFELWLEVAIERANTNVGSPP